MLETFLHVKLAKCYLCGSYEFKNWVTDHVGNHVSSHIVTNTMLLKLLDDISVKTIGLLFPPEPEFFRFT